MVDKEAPPDRRARMDLDAGAEACPLGEQARGELQAPLPEPVRDPVRPDGPEAGVGKHLPDVARRWVPVECVLYVLTETDRHALCGPTFPYLRGNLSYHKGETGGKRNHFVSTGLLIAR